MEEHFSKCLSKSMAFEQSGQKVKVIVHCEDLKDGDVPKLKNFLEHMFKEIMRELTVD